VNGGVIDQHAPLGHHLFQVAQAQWIGRIPANAHQHDLQRKVQPLDHPSQGRVLKLDVQRYHAPILADGLIATEPGPLETSLGYAENLHQSRAG
jgi:hypothetical protein